jgi:hypothetical protein
MIERQIDRPMPMPSGFVVWNGSNRREKALRAQPRAGVPHPDAHATFGRDGIDADL